MFNYSVQNLFVGGASPYSASFESIATHSIQGVQAANISLTFPRQDEFFWDGGGDRQMIERPRVELSLSYLSVSGQNEQYLGFLQSDTISALSSLNDERNYYLLINETNQELVSYSGWANKVISLGNGLITRYAFSAAVGQMSTVNANVEFLNALVQPSGTGQRLPAIYKQFASGATGLYTLPFVAETITKYTQDAPHNIVLAFDSGSAFGAMLSGNTLAPIQSFNFSVDIPRVEPRELGWAYPNVRPIQWPVNITIHADAYLNGIQLDAINRYGCPDSGFNFTVHFQDSCTTQTAFAYRFVGAKLDAETLSTQIGSSTKVSFDWSLKIMDMARAGDAPNFYITPGNRLCYNSGMFPEVSYAGGISGSLPLSISFGACCFLDIINGAGIINGNSINVTDDPGSVVTLRVTESGTNAFQDITVTVA